MKKRILSILLALTFLMASFTSYAASGGYETIRLGLFFGSTAKNCVTLKSDGGFLIGTVKNGVFEQVADAFQNELFALINANGVIEINGIYENADKSELSIRPKNGVVSVNGARYRGNIILLQSQNLITIINEVGLEEYLYSVIGKEMSPSWHLEALKAQAICARTYAINNWNKYSSYGFNLCTTQASQVYPGLSSETARTRQAVDETRGQTVKYNGKTAQTFFFSSDGGKTANVKYVWGSSFPYLVSVDDPFENAAEASYSNWTASFTASQIKEKLAAAGVDIGNIVDIYIDGADNGTVYNLVIKGDNGQHVLKNEKTRTFLGLKSQYYTVNVFGGELTLKNAWLSIKSVLPSVYKTKNESLIDAVMKGYPANGETTFAFNGKGWGHRIGMSQWGAKAMAEKGYNAAQILTYYFPGTTVE